jgi:hypothetical protein
MEFKKFSAGTKSYGTGKPPMEKQEDNVCFFDPELEKDLKSEGPEKEQLQRVLVFLSLCHTIVID